MAKLNYVELPVQDVASTKAFFAAAFGWDFTDFGPTYAATTSGQTDLGLQGDRADWTAAPLAVIQVEDVAAAASAVEAAGGDITRPVFDFPGGKRFHFRDPNGNELAAWQKSGE
jgi:predicted enzyme related to lactoylglutathione lyase